VNSSKTFRVQKSRISSNCRACEQLQVHSVLLLHCLGADMSSSRD
jgi:hypothetical protein